MFTLGISRLHKETDSLPKPFFFVFIPFYSVAKRISAPRTQPQRRAWCMRPMMGWKPSSFCFRTNGTTYFECFFFVSFFSSVSESLAAAETSRIGQRMSPVVRCNRRHCRCHDRRWHLLDKSEKIFEKREEKSSSSATFVLGWTTRIDIGGFLFCPSGEMVDISAVAQTQTIEYIDDVLCYRDLQRNVCGHRSKTSASGAAPSI